MLDIGIYSDSEGGDIQFITNVKDLGIKMTTDLSFDEHINVITAKGKQMAGWILRVFTSRAPFLMKTAKDRVLLCTMDSKKSRAGPTTGKMRPTLITGRD